MRRNPSSLFVHYNSSIWEREDACASIRFLYLRIDHFYMNFFSLFICLFPQFLIFLPMSWVAPGVLWERTKKKKKNGQIGTFSMETVIFFYHFFLLYDWWWQFFPFLQNKKKRSKISQFQCNSLLLRISVIAVSLLLSNPNHREKNKQQQQQNTPVGNSSKKSIQLIFPSFDTRESHLFCFFIPLLLSIFFPHFHL